MKKVIFGVFLFLLSTSNIFANDIPNVNSFNYTETYIEDTLFEISSDAVIKSNNFTLKEFLELYFD